MHTADVLAAFRLASTPLSTSHIVARVFESELRAVSSKLRDAYAGEEAKQQARDQKAKLHRRVLHHVNKLLDQGKLQVHSVGAKGEKFYTAVSVDRSGAGYSKQPTFANLIEGYEHKKVLVRYESETFFNKFNAILLEGTQCTSLQHFSSVIEALFGLVNDVVIVNDFEALLNAHGVEQVITTCLELERLCKDYNKRICMIFDMTNVRDGQLVVDFFQAFLPLEMHTFVSVFDVTSRELIEHASAFEELILQFSRYSIKFNIKNDEFHRAPMGIGRAGPYTFDPEKWSEYVRREQYKQGICVACVQASVILDVKRFFDEYGKAALFADMINKTARMMFLANTLLRSHASDHFEQLEHLGIEKNLFLMSKMAIRLWNYEFDHPNFSDDSLQNLLEEVHEQLQHFVATQKTIYLSCGMPCQFDIGFGEAYRRSSESTGSLLFESFDRISLRNVSDIYVKKNRERLLKREKIAALFDVGDEMRFHREGVVNATEVVREMQSLMHTYRFPLYCYTFSQRAGTALTLTHFLE